MRSNNSNDFIISFEIIKDCSTYNPCGRYGYCRDDYEDKWTCVCKFWWKGTICDTCESLIFDCFIFRLNLNKLSENKIFRFNNIYYFR